MNQNLSRLQLTVGSSILLIRTIRCLTPAVLASMACSLVWPPFSKPVSNSPFLAEITWCKETVGGSQVNRKKEKLIYLKINKSNKTNIKKYILFEYLVAIYCIFGL